MVLTMARWEKWVEKNPLKKEAHRAVSRALAKGELTAPDPSICPECGLETRLVAHHPDYAKPLDVEWLCFRCHWWTHSGSAGPPPPRKRRAPEPQMAFKQKEVLRRQRRTAERPRFPYRRTAWRFPAPHREPKKPKYVCDALECGEPASRKRFCSKHTFCRVDRVRRPPGHNYVEVLVNKEAGEWVQPVRCEIDPLDRITAELPDGTVMEGPCAHWRTCVGAGSFEMPVIYGAPTKWGSEEDTHVNGGKV